MRRRDFVLVAGGIAVVVALGAFLIHHINEQRRLANEAVRIALGQFNNVAWKALANADMVGPRLGWVAKLDGDATTVTFTVSNPTSHSYRDVTMQGFTLEKNEPREKGTLPIKIAELSPGGSHKFVLHYDHLVWLGDDVPVNRIDMGWAEKPLDFSQSWVAVIDPNSLTNDPNVNVKAGESKGSIGYSGVRIRLDEDDARAIKRRRDAGWKAQAAKHSSQPSSRP